MGRVANCIVFVCLFLSAPADAQPSQSPPGAVTERPDSPRMAASPAISNVCVYENAQFTIGAVKCISDKLWLVCQVPDANHPAAWWNAGQQPLCQGRFNTSPAKVTEEEPPRRVSPLVDSARRTGSAAQGAGNAPDAGSPQGPCCPLQSH
jgi:hypothetical protein